MATRHYWLAGVVCIAALAGCGHARHVTGEEGLNKSGFLGEALYEKLTPGDEMKVEPGVRSLR